MLRRRATTVLLSLGLATVAWPMPSTAADLVDPRAPELGPGQRLEALLDQVKAHQQALSSLRASFTQRKESALLLEPEEARGSFAYAAPDRVRWEYQSPNPMTVVIDGEEMLTWYRDLARADRVKIGRYSGQVFKYMGASSSIADLTEYFSVALAAPGDGEEPYRLHLEPRFRRIAKRIKSLTLWLDAASYLPVRLRFVEPDGDVTEYAFHDVEVNGQVSDEAFAVRLPGEVEVREVDLERGG